MTLPAGDFATVAQGVGGVVLMLRLLEFPPLVLTAMWSSKPSSA